VTGLRWGVVVVVVAVAVAAAAGTVHSPRSVVDGVVAAAVGELRADVGTVHTAHMFGMVVGGTVHTARTVRMVGSAHTVVDNVAVVVAVVALLQAVVVVVVVVRMEGIRRRCGVDR